MWVSMESADTDELAPTEGDVTRLRLILSGERAFAAESGATFVPSAEVGLRHDGGDAETGTGLELGAGLRYTAGRLSISAERANARHPRGLERLRRVGTERRHRGLARKRRPGPHALRPPRVGPHREREPRAVVGARRGHPRRRGVRGRAAPRDGRGVRARRRRWRVDALRRDDARARQSEPHDARRRAMGAADRTSPSGSRRHGARAPTPPPTCACARRCASEQRRPRNCRLAPRGAEDEGGRRRGFDDRIADVEIEGDEPPGDPAAARELRNER